MFCLDAETGAEIWKYSYRGGEPQTTPAVDGRYVYTLDKGGLVHCLNAKSGKVAWQKNIVRDYGALVPVMGFSGSPVVEGDLLILATKGCGMALNKKTGKLVWASEKPDGPLEPQTDYEYATPVIYDHSGRKHALIFHDKYLRSVSVETGVSLWSMEWMQVAVDPLVFDEKMLVSSSFGNPGSALFDIRGDAPEQLWSSDNLQMDFIGPVLVDGYVFGCDGGPNSKSPVSLQCVDVETGDLMWEETINSRALSMIAANDRLIVLDGTGVLRIVEAVPSGYTEISSCRVPGYKSTWWTPPVLSSGRVYCRCGSGDLVCIDVRKQEG